MDPVFADFATRPARLSNAVVRQHRCAVAPAYVVVASGGRLSVDFMVPGGEETAETELRLSVLGVAAPLDAEVNGEPVAKNFLLPGAEGPDTVREFVLTVPGTALRPGANVLEVRNAADGDGKEGDGVIRLRALTLDSVGHDGRALRTSGHAAGERSGWVFATERRRLGASAWQPGADLRLQLDRSETHDPAGEREPVTRLAWRGTTGAESSVAFRTDLSGFHGHFRDADGSLGELRGTLTGPLPQGGRGAGVVPQHFTTEEEHDGVWSPAGRLRLLLDDGSAPVDRVTWSDRAGAASSLSLLVPVVAGRPTAPGERRDVTELVTQVWASDEFTDFGEVARNLVKSGGKWLAHEQDPELSFTFDLPVAVSAYSLTSANDVPERDPADWVLEGSSDGRSWTRLDSRAGEVFQGRYQCREFTLARPEAHRHYRLRITDNHGADETQLLEVRFFDGGAEAAADGVSDFVGYRQSADGEPVGYRGTRIPAPVAGADGQEDDGAGELLAVDFSDTARNLQDAARLLEQLTRYLRP
ncbi:alpha-1,2-mannosidase [Streptomyces sp. NPDC060205]|uniref:alpha-1,2-mannosidase n=1 Tax=Streptomyces sp. NPDC060205 TaxID=3347072 RepID=UPI00365CA007